MSGAQVSLDTLPLLADAMTAADLAACERAIAALIGPNAEVRFLSSRSIKAVYASIEPHGYSSRSDRWYDWFDTWPDAICAAHAHAATLTVVTRNATIRRMALAVIGLTDEHGTCTEAALRRQEFTAQEIADLHEAACERAGEMCQGVPFVVVRECAA